MVNYLRQFLEKNHFLNSLLLQPYRDFRLRSYYRSLLPLNDLTPSERSNWLERIRKVKLSSDNARIDKHPDAGTFKGSKLVMHNGLIIDPLSYYGVPVMRMLLENKAVHEPQEEFVFQEVLKTIPENACMLELGCYWGFYSMWFNQKIKNAKNVLVDNKDGLQRAKANFAMNTLNADFFEAYIGKPIENSPVRISNVDELCSKFSIDFIHLLHCDIQGYELEMLETMPKQIEKNGIGYVFISTHSNELHYSCIRFLESNGFTIICHADLDQSFSEDGLIVAKAHGFKGIDHMEISLLQNA
jgi:hypothetical protein